MRTPPGAPQPRATTEAHAELLGPVRSGSGRSLDAVVVSASRPAANLRSAMRLAAGLGCRLVALCSGAARPGDVLRLAAGVPGLRHAVVPVPAGYGVGSVRFRTDAHQVRAGRLGDLSTKRTVGLLLGHRAGWESVLFLDDDIRALGPATVRRAVGALVPGGAAGMPAREFPDNSIVCHANRRTGYEQDVFVSGSALVVDCGRITSFFPRIYNEDWMFLAPAIAAGAVSEVGMCRQLAYEPFEDPERAATQEFGNVVADGLMSAMHQGDLGAALRPDFWAAYLPRRKDFIGGIARRTRGDDHAVLAALAAAERRRAAISPAELVAYVADWRRDLDGWQDGLARMSRGLPFRAVLRALALADGAVVSAGFDGPGPGNGILDTVSTRHLGDQDWAELRDLRLTALRESPAAFLSTYAQESAWTDDDWRREAGRGDWLVETEGDRPVAMLGATPEWDIPESDRYLSYLWVAPGRRRRGLGERLVRSMLDRLRDSGVEWAWLWVLDGNDPARRLYERLGFVSTGERQPLKDDPARCEERMRLALR